MRTIRTTLVTLCALSALSCSEPTSVPLGTTDEDATYEDLSGLPIAFSVVGERPAVCAEATVVGLMLGPDVRAGSVEVTNDEENLYVTYRSDGDRWVVGTALFVGASPADIPTTRRGIPRIFQFPYVSGHPPRTQEVVWEIPLGDVPEGELTIAAFGQVGLLPSWGEGEPITPGRDWAMYFPYRPTACAAQVVDASGGTVGTSDGAATLVLPEGALTGPVEITITPATVEEIQTHVAGIGVAAPALATESVPASLPGDGFGSGQMFSGPLPLIEGIRPIAGTLWDFDPDGLQFEKSGTLTLRYRDEDLPPDTDEQRLGVFLINGVIPYDRIGIVDAVANTVTVPMEHFSYGFIGFRETVEADLRVRSAGEVADVVAPGEAATYVATVANAGPGSVTDAFVLYQGFGDVTAGPLSEGCAADPAPIYATVSIRCSVGAIANGDVVQAPSASFVPQSEGTFEVWIDPGSDAADDPDPSNNRLTETFTAAVPAVLADLTISDAGESADTIELGLPVGYVATIQNLGPTSVTDARVFYSFFGNAIAGAVDPGCTVASPGIFANVEITCAVGALPDGGSATAPGVEFIPQETGDFTVWISSGSSATDPNAENNRQELSVTVLQRTADLEMQDIFDSADPANVGDPVVYTIEYLSADAQQPVDGALVRVLHGSDATFVESSTEGCVVQPTQVTCPTGTLLEGLIEGMTVTLLPAVGVSELVITATILVPFPLTDPDPSNNFQAESTTVGFGGSADLTISGLSESADPIAPGQSVTYQAVVQNFGPDAVADAVVYYEAFGDLAAGALSPGCTQTSVPATADVEVVCAVGVIDAQSGVALAPAATFTPQAPGTYTIWVSPGSSASDPNPDNNRTEASITVTAPGADLRVDQILDTPDPVAAGGQVTYQIQTIAMGSSAPVEGAVLRLLFTGTASYVSSSLPCSAIAGGVGCPLPALQPGLIQDVEIVASLPTAGQTVVAEATIVVPAGISDPNTANNTLSAQTTVVAPGPTQVTVGQVITAPVPGPGMTDTYEFQGTVGDIVRVSLSMLGPNGSGQLTVDGPMGRIFPTGTTFPTADELSSENHVLTLGATGLHTITVYAGGDGSYRLGLGSGVGRMDSTFGTAGRGYFKISATSNQTYFLDMVSVGNDVMTLGDTYLSRFDPAGTLVGSFGVGGRVDVLAALGGRATAFARQPDGKFVVVAPSISSPYPWLVGRFNADGSVDTGFGTNGVAQVNLGGNRSSAKPAAVGFQQNGAETDIVVAGDAGALAEQLGIIRLNPNGTLDAGFGTGGIVFENGGFAPVMMAVQSDGALLVGSNRNLRRYTAAGTRDATFGSDGRIDYPSGAVRAIRALPDGDIIGVGDLADDAMVLRLNPNGSQDGSFTGGGYATYDFGLPERFQSVVEDAQGRLVIAGYQRTSGGRYDQLAVRMSATGSLDASFAVGGYLIEGILDDARAVVLDDQGRILVGGQGRNAFGLHVSRHIPN